MEELTKDAPARILRETAVIDLSLYHCLCVLIILLPVAERVPICSRCVGYKKLEG